MAHNEVLAERRGQALVITLNRPEHGNALTFDMATQLYAILKPVVTDRSVRGVLIWGAGVDFMDGTDMSIYQGDLNAGLERGNQVILPYHSSIREMQAMDKPVIVAVEGHVTGPGISLMLAADLVIAARNSTFNCGFTKSGMSPDGGCSYFLPRKIGAGKAIELMMLSEDFDAEEAYRLHLVNKVVDQHSLEQEALSLLEHVSEGPTRAYAAVKKLSMSAFEQNLNGQLGLEHTYFGQNSRSFDFREVVKAFLAKRPPKFSGT